MKNSLDSIVSNVYIASLIVAFILIVGKKIAKKGKVQEELKTILFRIFIVQSAIMIPIHLQMPYRYQLYLETGLTHSLISEVICYHHLITAVWNIILPFAIKKIGHRALLIISTFFIAMSSLPS